MEKSSETLQSPTRFDAMRDLPIEWKWVGPGLSPQPTSKPTAVELAGQRVELDWPAKGWGSNRCFFVCPICSRHARFVYVLDNGRMGCDAHVSKNRVTREAALLGLKRAAIMARANRWKPRARKLREQSLAKLAKLST